MPAAPPNPRRTRGLILGGAGIALVFVPALLLIAVPGLPSIVAVAAMIVGIGLLIAGFLTLPGSLANLLRPKP